MRTHLFFERFAKLIVIGLGLALIVLGGAVTALAATDASIQVGCGMIGLGIGIIIIMFLPHWS